MQGIEVVGAGFPRVSGRGAGPIPAPQVGAEPLRAFAVSYAVEGAWDVERIKEDLFDTLGEITPLENGFVCTPDELHPGTPEIALDPRARTVRFGLFGPYEEKDVAGPMLQAAAEFSQRYELDLNPLIYERWEFQSEHEGYNLVERRPLGTVLRGPAGRTAHA